MSSTLAHNSWLSLLPRYSLLRNDDRKAALAAQGRKIFDFGIGDPQEETPAFIREALIGGLKAVSQYPSAIGSLDFRKSCAAWAQKRFGVALSPQENIISSNGSKESVFHIPHILLNAASARRIVVFPDPGYPVYKASTILSGGVPYQVSLRPEKNYVFEPADIPREILPQVAAVWVSYPHNPTGATISRQKMEEIYEWALANDLVLLSDECYVDMFFPGSTPPESFLSVAQKNQFKNLLCFYSLSKRSGMTGYRSGFVAGDKALVGAFAKYRPNAGLGTPEFVQRAAMAAWADDEHVVERNAIFAEKRKLVEAFFKRNGLELLASNATFYVWAKTPKNYANSEEFAAKLADATGIIVTPGDALGDSCADWFRLALVPTAESIKECLHLWQKSIDSGVLPCRP